MVTRAVFLVDDNGKVINKALKPRAGKTQAVSDGGTSNTFSTACVVRIIFSTQGFLAIKSTGTASASDTYMAASFPEWFRIDADEFVCVKTPTLGTAYIDILN